MSSSNTRPLAGVWQRVFEEDPLGDAAHADRDTLVLWTQAAVSGIYVDLRLPQSSPGRPRRQHPSWIQPRPAALAGRGFRSAQNKERIQQDDALYQSLLDQKSFAGVLDCRLGDTTESGAALRQDFVLKQLADRNDAASGALPLCTCVWRRDLDFQPPAANPDIGVCASQSPFADGSVLLRETGADASYAEGWLRLAGTHNNYNDTDAADKDGRGSACCSMALELESENGVPHCRTGYWVRTANNRFAYAVGRVNSVANAQALGLSSTISAKVQECANQSLKEALKTMVVDGDKDVVLDHIVGSYVAVAGKITTPGGKWIIQYSTQPELVGCELVGKKTNNNSNNDDDDDAYAFSCCCSTLVQTEDGIVVQSIPVDGEGSVVTRTWKVVELSGCDLPIS